MKDKSKMLSGLLKAGIIAAGAGVGMLISRCFSVDEEPEGESNEPDFIDVDCKEVEETEEV